MDYTIPLNIKSDIKCQGRQIGDYLYDEGTDTIYYQLPYPFPCKFAVKSLSEITVTPMMLKLPSFLKYHNIDWLRQQLMQIKCVQDDAVLIHGAAWEVTYTNKNKVGHLVVGFPNSGKTTMALRAIEQPGVLFCADENVIIKGGIMYPVVRQTSLSPWLAKQIDYPLTIRQRIRFLISIIKSKIFPIFEPNIFVDLPYERVTCKLDQIKYLTSGKKQSLALLTDNEFPFFTNPVIQTYAYATGFDIDAVYKKYRSLIDEIERVNPE